MIEINIQDKRFKKFSTDHFYPCRSLDIIKKNDDIIIQYYNAFEYEYFTLCKENINYSTGHENIVKCREVNTFSFFFKRKSINYFKFSNDHIFTPQYEVYSFNEMGISYLHFNKVNLADLNQFFLLVNTENKLTKAIESNIDPNFLPYTSGVSEDNCIFIYLFISLLEIDKIKIILFDNDI